MKIKPPVFILMLLIIVGAFYFGKQTTVQEPPPPVEKYHNNQKRDGQKFAFGQMVKTTINKNVYSVESYDPENKSYKLFLYVSNESGDQSVSIELPENQIKSVR